MHADDLDPNYLLPLWRALVRYFRTYPPLVQSELPRLSRVAAHPTGKVPTQAWPGHTPHRI
ncbi:MAG TPA: hypothetical protein VLG68_10820 [Gammaproteobacteria bacterium]|nr:hypothetical protein [Gammaproteobacteria bacterium]